MFEERYPVSHKEKWTLTFHTEKCWFPAAFCCNIWRPRWIEECDHFAVLLQLVDCSLYRPSYPIPSLNWGKLYPDVVLQQVIVILETR